MISQKVCIRVLADIDQINRCKSKLAIKKRDILQPSTVLGLAGNEARFKILYSIYEENELCVCDLSDILSMNISAVSQHLRKLKDGDMLDVRKEGQTYFYYIKSDFKSVFKSFLNIINSKSDNITSTES